MGFVTGKAPAAALRNALGEKAAACIYILYRKTLLRSCLRCKSGGKPPHSKMVGRDQRLPFTRRLCQHLSRNKN